MKHILGDEIIALFTDKEIGDADAISRILDEVPFYVIGMKEPDYIMQTMTPYGTMKQLGDQKLAPLDGGNMDDNTLAKLCVLFPTGSDYGECTKCWCLFL